MVRKCAFAALFTLVVALPARALDSVSFEAGRGNNQVDMWRVGAQWNWKKKWLSGPNWYLGAYWELSYGDWNNHIGNSITDVSLSPVFRLQQARASSISPYVEAAIGFHMLSRVRISSSRVFSTHFQYGDHIGAGVRFGDAGRYDTSVRLQHLSNGGLAHPNPGINYLQLRFQYHF
jgi:hypothetical protein